MPPLPVKGFHVQFADESYSLSYPALLKSAEEVAVVSKVAGYIESRYFQEGEYVKEGAKLYEIDKAEYTIAQDRAKAAVQRAEVLLKKASKDWERAEYLYSKEAISTEQRDAALYSYEDAKAALSESKAALKRAELDLEYTTISAPISGRIGITNFERGSFIASANTPLASISQTKSLYAEFYIPSKDMQRISGMIKLGKEVKVNYGANLYKGALAYIAPSFDTQSDSLLIRVKIENKNEELSAGAYATATIDELAYGKVAKIPQNAILNTPKGSMVYVVNDGAAQMRPVTMLGSQNGEAVIQNGLQEGETIIASNIAKVRPDAKVSLIKE